jgi:hypothetical protein
VQLERDDRGNWNPAFNDWPLVATPAEHHALSQVLGSRLDRVEYEDDSDLEFAYLRGARFVVALAALPVTSDSAWRIGVLEPPVNELPPMSAKYVDLGNVERATFYSDRWGGEFGLCIECSTGTPLWAWCAGGDFVNVALGEAPEPF